MKTILITGATDGIGKLLALKLAQEGHQLLVHGRNSQKLNETLLEIKQAAKNSEVHGYTADLSEVNRLESLIDEISTKYSKIDVLINNAGVFKSFISKTAQGFDVRFAVNYFAPYILTHGLLPLLKNSSEPRIINLSSAAQSSLSLDAMEGKEVLSSQEAYAQSKLAITMWSFWLAKQDPQLHVIPVNPGSLLNTKMVQEAFGQFWSPANKGADILFDLATSDSYKAHSGEYFDNDRGAFGTAHPDAYDDDKITELITRTNKLLNQ